MTLLTITAGLQAIRTGGMIWHSPGLPRNRRQRLITGMSRFPTSSRIPILGCCCENRRPDAANLIRWQRTDSAEAFLCRVTTWHLLRYATTYAKITKRPRVNVQILAQLDRLCWP